MASVRLDVLVAPECPHGEETLSRVQDVAARLAPRGGASVELTVVSSYPQARETGLAGSPTVLVNGADLEPSPSAPDGAGVLSCRLYDGTGLPPTWLIEARVLRALDPAHVLFLCVANSARSQMAEAIARSLAPPGVRVSSAGSAPTTVRPEALAVLAELGLDATGQRSKGLEDITPPVDAVITLCAEEVCPVWLEPAPKVHWALPDPAAAEGDEAARLTAFRLVRDELRLRLSCLF